MRGQRRFHHKFLDAVRGLRTGVAGQSSFGVHAVATLLVMAAGVVLRVALAEWALLTLCITVVWSAELFNSALESIARAVRPDYDPQIGRALDIASAAVLIAAAGAAAVGITILGYRLGFHLGWWPALTG